MWLGEDILYEQWPKIDANLTDQQHPYVSERIKEEERTATVECPASLSISFGRRPSFSQQRSGELYFAFIPGFYRSVKFFFYELCPTEGPQQ